MQEQAYRNEDGSLSVTRSTTQHTDYTPFPFHSHISCEIYLLRSESALFRVEGTLYPIRAGDILLFNNREFHNVTFDLTKPYARTTVQVRADALAGLPQTGYDLFAGFERRKPGVGNHIPAQTAQDSGITALIEELESAAFTARAGRDLLTLASLIRLLMGINDVVAQSDVPLQPAQRNQKVAEILQYINANLAEDLSLSALEKRFYMSRYHLSHIFKDATGFSVSQYVTNKRVKHAEDLITRGSSTLDACIASGFGDYSNFYKTFKRLTGHTPKASKRDR